MVKWIQPAFKVTHQSGGSISNVTEDQPTQEHQQQAAPPVRFAVSATFTAEPIAPALRYWAKRLNRDFEVRFAPYNQLLQTLHDPAGEFAANPSGLNLMLARIEDLGQFIRIDEDSLRQIGGNVDHLAEALASAATGFAAPVLLAVCAPSPGFESGSGGGFSRRQAAKLKDGLKGIRNLVVADWTDLEALYPVATPFNEEGERLGRIPYTDEFFAALATAAVRHWDALTRPPYKVIAVDCDNTLWAGICGEDGPEHVRLDEAHRSLHDLLLKQREAGMVLTMVSKNNERDVHDTFAAHPEFPLRPEHFAAWRINWQPKEDNLAELAGELNLGLDSFIFIDDNPKECAEVSDAAPEVLTIPLPADPAQTRAFLERIWAFDHPVITEEDRKRSESYAKGRDFAREIRSAASLDDFISKLGLAVHVTGLQAETLPRAAQLTQRTNQFNTTTIRRTEADIERLVADPSWHVYTATVADRFGEYGVTALLIMHRQAAELRIDSFMLSCRVLGRGVEHRIMRFAGQTAFDFGLETVAVDYTASARNAPASQFLDSIPGGRVESMNGTRKYRFSAAGLVALSWKPAPAGSGHYVRGHHPVSGRRFWDYSAVATHLGTARQVLDALRSEFASASPAGAGGSFATETEAAVSRIWAELLRRPSVAATDNFFDLGGHSLLAVLLLMRIKEEFGVELSVDDVYSATLTLSELAGMIDAARLGGGDDEYEKLLRELEGMSDEEVQALLEQAESEQQAQE
ncbi:MAG: HAD-IIIC family phosphatase [Bryobacteraceae bacterium]|nr:HAD-IIIC family phosphatase [Bryobacteraceae bacterium]